MPHLVNIKHIEANTASKVEGVDSAEVSKLSWFILLK